MAGFNTTVPGTTSTLLNEGGNLQKEAENLFALAWHAGFRGNNAITAVAVAMAENASAQTNLVYSDPTGPAGPEYSIGPWQINIGTVNGSYSGFNAGQLADPFNNAAAAFGKFSGAGGKFSPWTTYTKGDYLKYMGYATAAGININPGGAGDQVNSILEHIHTITGSNVNPPGEGGSSGTPGGGGSDGGSGGVGQQSTYHGLVVLIAAFLFLILGAVIWKGMSTVKVQQPTITVKTPQRTIKTPGA